MRILVISNLFPPAFLGGYEIGAAWVCHELRRRGHEIMLWTASCVIDGRRDGFRILHQPQNSDYRWLPAGPCVYGMDLLGGILLNREAGRHQEVAAILQKYFESYPEQRRARREQIEQFGPELVLTFNPACLLDPVFAELAGMDCLTGVRSLALVSDDWLLRWRHSHPLIFVWRHFQWLRQTGPANLSPVDAAFFELGQLLEQNGLFAFDAPPDFNELGFTSEFLRRKSQPAIPAGVPTRIVHWGLPDVAGYPHVGRQAFQSRDPLCLAYCGQMQPHKGLIMLLQALQHTKRPHKLVVVGDDSSDYGRFCHAFVRQAGLEARVSFTGKIPPSEVAPKLAAQTQILMLPSRADGVHGFEEPFSIVLLQGMAMGMAAAASRTGGSLEAIVDHESGRFFEYDQPLKIAAVIDELEAKREQTRRLAAKGRERIEREFTVETMVDRLLEPSPSSALRPATLFFAARNATIDPANSGCVRVTRRLGRTLEEAAPIVFSTWNSETGVLQMLRPDQAEVLGRFHGPRHAVSGAPGTPPVSAPIWRHFVRNGWLVLPEIMPAAQLDRLVDYAARQSLRTAAIFYDSIALLQPEFCSEEIRANHAEYMRRLARCDLVIPISHFSEKCLREFWQAEDVRPTRLESAVLPGEFAGARIETRNEITPGAPIHVLCVSTLEPRKNHRRLLAAFQLARQLRPDLDLRLDLVGNSYAGAMDITRDVEAAAAACPWLTWWRIVDDTRLRELYMGSHFTVYPSMIEGFGLPILESIWHGRPCICSDDGVMAELASEGGCLAVDIRDEAKLADAIVELADNGATLARLCAEAAQRPLKTWLQYSTEIQQLLSSST